LEPESPFLHQNNEQYTIPYNGCRLLTTDPPTKRNDGDLTQIIGMGRLTYCLL
jgi:hypothetical protein